VVTGPRESALEGVTLRAFGERDLEFLYRVYAASRDREIVLLAHWSEAEQQTFLRDQFRLQHTHYQKHYPNARFDLICAQGADIGRLYVASTTNEIRLMDIALLPERRGRGIGSALIREVMAEASSGGRPVSLHVEPDNPARRLYTRLGFVDVEQVGAYTRMRWPAPAQGTS
jgi:ribosomal protein S18 acetylase RimI-like enzyme